MPKRRPTQVITHRIELQQSERDLLEAALIGNGMIRTVDALAPVFTTFADPVKLYGLLTLLEAAGVIDTPVPTLIDAEDNVSAAVVAIKDFLGLQVEYQHREDANIATAQTAATQAEEANERAQNDLSNTAQAHANGQASWDDVRSAQDRANEAQALAWREAKIAQSWEYWFYFQESDRARDRGEDPPKGRWPTRKEVSKAKKDGVYYDNSPNQRQNLTQKASGFLVGLFT